jgi:hypothetical protein
MIPSDIAAQIPAVAANIRKTEQAIISLCHSPEFSVETLRAAVAKQRS